MADYLPPVVARLQADVGDFIAKIEAAKAALKGFGDTSETVRDKVRVSTHDESNAITDFERLVSSKMKSGETALQALQREIANTKQRIQELQRAAAGSTGNSGITILGDLRTARADLRALENMVTNIGAVGAPSGQLFMKKFTETASAEAVDFGGVMWPVIIGSIAAGLPFVGGSLGGAVGDLLGFGGIAAGIIAQIHNPEVMSAVHQFGSDMKDTFKLSTDSFVGALRNSFGILDQMLRPVVAQLGAAINDLAPTLEVLAEGLGKSAQELMPGLVAGLESAKPLLDEFARDLPILMKGLGVMFQEIAAGSKGGAEGMGVLLRALAALLALVGGIIYLFEILNEGFIVAVDSIVKLFSAVFRLHQLLGPFARVLNDIRGGAKSTADTFKMELTPAIDSSREALIALSKEMDDFLQQALDAQNATLLMMDAQQNLTDAIAKNGRNWDINTQAGRDNTEMLLRAIEKAKEARTAAIAHGQAVQVADAAYDQQIQKLIAIAKRAGDAQANLQALAGTYYIDVEQDWKTFFINKGTPPSQFYHGLAGGGVVRAANGLAAGVLTPTAPGTLVLAGEPETGGEVFMPLRGIPRSRAMRLAQMVGDAYGFDVTARPTRNAAVTMASPLAAGGYVPILVQMGSAHMTRVLAQLIPVAQQYKIRTGVTGLS